MSCFVSCKIKNDQILREYALNNSWSLPQSFDLLILVNNTERYTFNPQWNMICWFFYCWSAEAMLALIRFYFVFWKLSICPYVSCFPLLCKFADPHCQGNKISEGNASGRMNLIFTVICFLVTKNFKNSLLFILWSWKLFNTWKCYLRQINFTG